MSHDSRTPLNAVSGFKIIFGQMRGEAEELRQIVLNLLSSAVKFTNSAGESRSRREPAGG